MNNFWNSYLNSISEQENKILVRWDTCLVGTYNSVEEAREHLSHSTVYNIDSTDFWYKEYGSNKWKQLYVKTTG